MGLVIDGFSHILPKSFIRELSLFHPTDELRASGSLTHLSEIENRIRVLDKYRIDKQVLTLARPSIWANMAKDTALKMTRVANDTLYEITQKYSDRFIPVGT
jgi:predicted TIM-barrel fold metal-dependent hydrolase